MASRKDFVQRSRKQSPASPNRPAAAKPRAKATPAPKRKPWKLALFSLVALAGLVFLLNQLLNVDSIQTPQTTTVKKQTSTPVKKPVPVVKRTEKKVVATKPTVIKKPASGPKVVEKSVEAKTVPKQNKYEFYELLPKDEITPAAVKEYKSTPRSAKLDKTYVLQAGSFRNAADAEKMRAQLLLSGLKNVHTNPSNGANGLWYRVRIGPFDNRSVMNKAHDKLARLNINALTIRVD
ncbi:SPOR domain-containing protein [Neptunomonas japonica]|uniref:SPOR domain-containing protein n=1 Tax=Neptunomonas japonica TaxID=417574 RepID=UPI00041FC4A7|nr:SPOR domain-containing protein [Neptunomonas japonica]